MPFKDRLSAYTHRGLREARRVVVLIVGSTVVLFGIILIFTPGPAFVVIPAGLAILSLEFAFARRWLKKVREMAGLEKIDDNKHRTSNTERPTSKSEEQG